jgi:hypothetical protein
MMMKARTTWATIAANGHDEFIISVALDASTGLLSFSSFDRVEYKANAKIISQKMMTMNEWRNTRRSTTEA